MPTIIYVTADRSEHRLEVAVGMTVMEGATMAMIPGIDAECGGSCACATCMVYVPPEWGSAVPAVEPMEEAMLESNPHCSAESRLSCQLRVTEALEGLRVIVPTSQR